VSRILLDTSGYSAFKRDHPEVLRHLDRRKRDAAWIEARYYRSPFP
jgi:hypothetical protein